MYPGGEVDLKVVMERVEAVENVGRTLHSQVQRIDTTILTTYGGVREDLRTCQEGLAKLAGVETRVATVEAWLGPNGGLSVMLDRLALNIQTQMKDSLDAVRLEMKKGFEDVRSEMKDGFQDVNGRMNEIDKRLTDVETTLKDVDKRTALTQVGMDIVARLLGLAKKSTPERLRIIGGSIFEVFGWWKGRKENIEVEEVQAEDGLAAEGGTPDGEDGSGDAPVVVAKHEPEEVD